MHGAATTTKKKRLADADKLSVATAGAAWNAYKKHRTSKQSRCEVPGSEMVAGSRSGKSGQGICDKGVKNAVSPAQHKIWAPNVRTGKRDLGLLEEHAPDSTRVSPIVELARSFRG